MLRLSGWVPAKGAARIIFLVFVLAVMAVAFTQNLRSGDDTMYRNALQDKPLFEYVAHRYQVWSGRFLIDAITVATVQSVTLWRLCTTAMVVLLFGMLAYYLGVLRRPLQLALLCAGLFLVDPEVTRPAFWWMTGSFNYAWPLALATLALLPFVRPDLSRRIFFLTLPAAAYACNQEQVGLMLLGLETVLGFVLWRQQRFRGWHLLQMLLGSVSLLSVVLAPGTAARFSVHTIFWFPQYLQLDLVERMFSGFQLAFGHVFAAGNTVAFLLAVALLAAVFQKTRNFVDRALVVIPVALFSLPMAVQLLGGPGRTEAAGLLALAQFPAGRTGGPDRFPEFWIGMAGNSVEPLIYLHFLLCCIGVLSMGTSLHLVLPSDGRWRSGLGPLLWIAGLCSAAMVGLAPSLYASAARIFFFQDMLTLLLLCAVASRFATSGPRQALLLVASPFAAVGFYIAVRTTS